MTLPNQNSVRRFTHIVHGRETSDGAGVRLRRYIASPELDMLDPFLLLDVFRSDDPNDYIAGFPPHPHRGFETVTYLLHGQMRHKDSAGHEGVIRAGGVQWMTAGSGIEHSEMPEQDNGLLYGFQIWVNLPASEKMRPPRYQEFEPEQIPLEEHPDGSRIRAIAGETRQGTRGIVSEIAAQPLYFDVSLPAGGEFSQLVPPDHNVVVYVAEGALTTDDEQQVLEKEQLAVLGNGDNILLKAEQPSRFLLLAGKPFREKVARYGPFVMNTQEEILQAFTDYRSGQFGRVEA